MFECTFLHKNYFVKISFNFPFQYQMFVIFFYLSKLFVWPVKCFRLHLLLLVLFFCARKMILEENINHLKIGGASARNIDHAIQVLQWIFCILMRKKRNLFYFDAADKCVVNAFRRLEVLLVADKVAVVLCRWVSDVGNDIEATNLLT